LQPYRCPDGKWIKKGTRRRSSGFRRTADQLQLDVFGELIDALYQARKHFLAPVASAWAQQQTLIEHLEDIWELPDQGIWEVRGLRFDVFSS
jgi:GH15 family glucan-1,4-alpha-glucosidase